jgi:hypothetical protein
LHQEEGWQVRGGCGFLVIAIFDYEMICGLLWRPDAILIETEVKKSAMEALWVRGGIAPTLS